MKILVTGATGRIGQRFVRRLMQQQESVRILVRRRETAVAPALLGAEVAFGDVTLADTLGEALDSVDVVVHLAADTAGEDPDLMGAINVGGTLSLARAALAAGATRLVYANTGLVYPRGSLPAAEDARLDPEAPYPSSKLAGERGLLRLAADGDLDVRVLRLAFVHGDGDTRLREALPRLAPAARLQLVHHIDVHRALMLAIRLPGLAGEIYNVADDAPLTVREIGRMYGLPTSGEAAADGLMDTFKIRTRLGFRPAIPSLFAAQADGLL